MISVINMREEKTYSLLYPTVIRDIFKIPFKELHKSKHQDRCRLNSPISIYQYLASNNRRQHEAPGNKL